MLYDDGDVEDVKLWSANQTVILCTTPNEWQEEKARLAK